MMLMSGEKLKEILRNIKKNEFKVPKDLIIQELTTSMMANIGDTDPELRDDLIYEVFCNWISDEVIESTLLKQLLEVSLDDQHLFYKIGEKDSDSVFTRTFSALFIALVVESHRKRKFLSLEELKNTTHKVNKYILEEKDLRGYVEIKGWAHSMAHGADILNELVQCSSIESTDCGIFLEIIKKKVSVNSYVYVSQENERLSLPVVNIIKRDLLDTKDIISWINSFGDLDRIHQYPEDVNLIVNICNFLRSIYFRLLKLDNASVINEAIKETLNRLITF